MVDFKTINKMVCGIAFKYASNLKSGKNYDPEAYREYKQELYLEAYKIMGKKPDVDEGYLAKCLLNRAGEYFHFDNKRTTKEFTAGCFDHEESFEESNPEFDLAYIRTSASKPVIDEETENSFLVDVVLDMIKNRDDNLKKYVIAKLKLYGYIPPEQYPEVDVDSKEYDESDISENHKILKDVLNMNGAPSGGTNEFKENKRKLFLDLMSEFNLEDQYKRWFEVTYIDTNGLIQVKSVKKYSKEEAEKFVSSQEDCELITSVVLEE